MADYLVTDTELTSVANAIRTKGGTSAQLTFPQGFIDAVGAIPTGAASDPPLGAIRSDAELVKRISYDKYVVRDLGITLPAYTTSTKTLVASSSLTDEAVECNLTLYQYYVCTRILLIPFYSISDVSKGRVEYYINEGGYEIFGSRSGGLPVLSDPSARAGYTENSCFSTGYSLSVYAVSATAYSTHTSTTGVYASNQSPMFSGYSSVTGEGRIIPRSPYLFCKGDSSRFTQQYMDSLTDIRFQYVIDLFRAPNDKTYDGWLHTQQFYSIIDAIENGNNTLA